ncbi:MAG TPA: hypothetical protein VNL15_06850, partial [Dehalococcoidia bacterium]|nr:hypothetical protein [Dehalococcoidia bacterium]
DDPHSSLPLELALIEFASNAQEPAAARASGEAAPASPAEPKSSSRRTEDLSKPSPEAKSEPAEQEVPPPSETALAPFPELPPDLLKQIRLVCKDSDHRLAAMLNGSCELLRLEGDSLVFGVYFNFHLEKLEAPANRRIIENAASQVLGRPLTIRCELVSPPPVKQSPRSLVEAAQEMGAMLLEGQGPP